MDARIERHLQRQRVTRLRQRGGDDETAFGSPRTTDHANDPRLAVPGNESIQPFWMVRRMPPSAMKSAIDQIKDKGPKPKLNAGFVEQDF